VYLYTNYEFVRHVIRFIKTVQNTQQINIETKFTLAVVEPECTNDKAIYQVFLKPRCPSELGREVAEMLKAAYLSVMVILLLNLLIAQYR
jgi:hypothetical protein